MQAIVEKRFDGGGKHVPTGPDQCHDITVYPAIGYAGGACEWYGLLLDIRDPSHPVRLDAVGGECIFRSVLITHSLQVDQRMR